MNPEKAYAEILQLSRETSIAASCLQLLQWDEEICMPRGGVTHRIGADIIPCRDSPRPLD
jgi:Zn-dependent M32 family carboxypeptidase